MNRKVFLTFFLCVLFSFNTFALTAEELSKKISPEEVKVLFTFLALTASAGEYALAYGSFPTLEQLIIAKKPVSDDLYLEKSILADAQTAGYTFSFVGEGVAYLATAVSLEKKGHIFYRDEQSLCVSDEVGVSAPTAHTERGCPVGFSEIVASAPVVQETKKSSIDAEGAGS